MASRDTHYSIMLVKFPINSFGALSHDCVRQVPGSTAYHTAGNILLQQGMRRISILGDLCLLDKVTWLQAIRGKNR
jgi:hypothetical protein